jgi:hypothetical protein
VHDGWAAESESLVRNVFTKWSKTGPATAKQKIDLSIPAPIWGLYVNKLK